MHRYKLVANYPYTRLCYPTTYCCTTITRPKRKICQAANRKIVLFLTSSFLISFTLEWLHNVVSLQSSAGGNLIPELTIKIGFSKLLKHLPFLLPGTICIQLDRQRRLRFAQACNQKTIRKGRKQPSLAHFLLLTHSRPHHFHFSSSSFLPIQAMEIVAGPFTFLQRPLQQGFMLRKKIPLQDRSQVHKAKEMFCLSSFSTFSKHLASLHLLDYLSPSIMRVHLTRSHTGKLCLHHRDSVTAPMAVFCSLLRTHRSSQCTPRQQLVFLQQNVFAGLWHGTSHILKAYNHFGAKAEFVPTDLQQIFWKHPSDLLILPLCVFLSLCFFF